MSLAVYWTKVLAQLAILMTVRDWAVVLHAVASAGLLMTSVPRRD